MSDGVPGCKPSGFARTSASAPDQLDYRDQVGGVDSTSPDEASDSHDSPESVVVSSLTGNESEVLTLLTVEWVADLFGNGLSIELEEYLDTTDLSFGGFCRLVQEFFRYRVEYFEKDSDSEQYQYIKHG